MSFPKITKVAKYVPELVIPNNQLSEIMDTTDDWITSRTGIHQRHIATSETTSQLASKVAKKLVATLDVKSIDFIIVATMTPDYTTPSTACLVQQEIGATNAFALDVSAACSGFVYALSTAEKFLLSGIYKKGLVIGAETMSNILNWQDRSTAVLFGDGAAGVLIETTASDPMFLAEKLQADGSRAMALTARKLPNNQPLDVLSSDEQSFLAMDGKKIFDFVLRDVSGQIVTLLANNSEIAQSLDYVLAHQANERILDALAKKTKIARDKFLSNVRYYGNTSAASIPLLLADKVEDGTLTLTGKQTVLLTGFGGGLTFGSLLIKL
ncbi:3-oxoacyl-ACP synthase [Vagococcus penaei]|uniref:Beta-ketoacyl-[acyl-carrier-protein] synthase III n=1 Tax=Vagococcus penaei TaxID=633807 RepID=A0A1Q2D8Q1_9ENTE|nr:beta-ketoacyl-ACP synthase III [Vagococcus penaei]AQP54737.1 3-oxoacyl-ACP synthase [Vagococcus penaei]RSU05393.1 3-oxoacyl-ACP synthase [Vagococcus penaei]